MNEGIDPCLCSLQYTSVDKVARVAQSMGQGTLLAKLDIKRAYRRVLVHTNKCFFAGVCEAWPGRDAPVQTMSKFSLQWPIPWSG